MPYQDKENREAPEAVDFGDTNIGFRHFDAGMAFEQGILPCVICLGESSVKRLRGTVSRTLMLASPASVKRVSGRALRSLVAATGGSKRLI
jgi:hypothetical protein